MKIAVLTAQAPFIRGGAERLAMGLCSSLRERGHQVELLAIPFKWYPPQAVLEQLLACRLLRVDVGSPDLVIGLKFPAYLAPFSTKRLWLLHQFRQVYDFWGGSFHEFPNTIEAASVREMIVRADNRALRACERIYTISRTVAERLKRFNDLEADGVLYPPLLDPDRLYAGPAGDYFFYPSRLNPTKRQDLAIEALCLLPRQARLILAGAADVPEYEQTLRRLVAQAGLSERVVFAGYVSEARKAELYAGCLAVLNLPSDEDYGYVTLEAMQAHKPLVTCSDSGGATELVEPELTGLLAVPRPRPLGETMLRLWREPGLARSLGEQAFGALTRRRLSWDTVVDELTR